MDDKGFLKFDRVEAGSQSPEERVKHYGEFNAPLPPEQLFQQAARCMGCGIPYCHGDTSEAIGCPTHNEPPVFNNFVHIGDWKAALRNLHSTNNFPEVTGRICPAPCEASCTLNLEGVPVTIKAIECSIIDRGWEEGWVVPEPPKALLGTRVAIVGSGPAGLACAQQLARVGHDVHVFEKNNKAGGLLRYGIPDFKLEKRFLDRRVEQMTAEGVTFHYGAHIGVNQAAGKLVSDFDAVVLAGGCERPRDLAVSGRELGGVHFAMEFLPQQNRRNGGEASQGKDILATDRDVVVIGGGDTGSDCIGTAWRQGARSVTQLEIADILPEQEDKARWPLWQNTLRTSSSHDEGPTGRQFSVGTQHFSGADGCVTTLHCVKATGFNPLPGTEFTINADLVLLAMGFVAPVREGMLGELGVMLDPKGNVLARFNRYQTSMRKVFAAGDMRRGQSLVVRAINEGRGAAQAVDAFLRGGNSTLRGSSYEA